MKISAKRACLLAAVAQVARVVPSHPVKEHLSYLRILVGNPTGTPGAWVSATDLEVQLTAWSELEAMERSGEVCVPAQRLLAILKALPEGDLSLEVLESVATIRSGSLEYQLPTIDPDLIPMDDSGSYDWELVIQDGELQRGLQAVTHQAATETARFTMTGVYLVFDGTTLQAVATDGRRLAVRDITTNIGPQPSSVILPNKAAALAEKMPHDLAKVSWSKKGVQIGFYDVGATGPIYRATLISRIIEGRFPAYKAVFPKGPPLDVFEAPAQLFSGSIRQAALVTTKEQPRVDLTLSPGQLKLAATGQGSSSVHLPVDSRGSNKIAINPSYLLDALAPVQGQARISLWGETMPLTVTAPGYTALVMPLS